MPRGRDHLVSFAGISSWRAGVKLEEELTHEDALIVPPFQGLNSLGTAFPKALPWAGLFGPFGAGDLIKVRFIVRGDLRSLLQQRIRQNIHVHLLRVLDLV